MTLRIIIAGILFFASIIHVDTCHSFTLEMDLSGLGSADRENREAFDRVRDGSTEEIDFERAREFERDREPDLGYTCCD